MSSSEYLQHLPLDPVDWLPFDVSDVLLPDAPATQSDNMLAENFTATESDVVHYEISAPQSRPRPSQPTLPLLQLADWSKEKDYDE